ncbi:MAG: DNA-processing protein DprA [Patescibacteria group bacterium]
MIQLAQMELKTISKDEFPAIFPALLEIPEPPEKLYYRGTLSKNETILLAVVGSRKYSSYGKDVCEYIIKGLRGYDIAIVSGLALGIDSIAHRAALDAGLTTIAVPGSGLSDEVLYPREHFFLAKEIMEKGGALVSEFEPDFRATPYSFPQRNRIMAGLSKAVLIIEAEERSGTLITARLALDYGRDVFTVPGSIFSENARGAHWLIRQGATPITSASDLLSELGIETETAKESILPNDLAPEEMAILELLKEPLTRGEIIEKTEMQTEKLNGTLSILEIKELIKEEGGRFRRC